MLSEGIYFKSYVQSEKSPKMSSKSLLLGTTIIYNDSRQCNHCMKVTEPCITLRLCIQMELSKPLESSHENLQILEWSSGRVKY